MRLVVFIVFFVIFSAATLVWIMNDPDMSSWKHSSVLSVVDNLTGQASDVPPVPLGNVKPKEVDPMVKALAGIEKRLSVLTTRFSKIEKGFVDRKKPQPGLRLEKIEETITEQESRLKSQQNEISVLKKKSAALRMENGILLSKKGDKNWQLANMFSKKRILQQRVNFATPFSTPPKITLGITTIELLNEKTRVRAQTSTIETTGFTLQLETKSETRIGEISINWAAFGR
jgi:hypothetical protein